MSILWATARGLKNLEWKCSNDVNEKCSASDIKLRNLFMIILVRAIMPFKWREKVDDNINAEESIHEVLHDEQKAVASLGDKSCPVW